MKHENLNEGAIKTLVDYATAFRIIRMLWLPWEQQKAYRLGLVDINGNKLKKAETPEEKSEMTPLVILVFKLKRLLQNLPAGSKIGSIAAAYGMLKEQCIADGIDANQLDEMFSAYTKDLGIELNEDVPVNVSVGIAGHDSNIVKRNRWKDLDKIAGSHTFEVPDTIFDKAKLPKEKGAKWDDYLDDSDDSIKIRQFAKTYPSKSIILRRAGSQQYQWLRKID